MQAGRQHLGRGLAVLPVLAPVAGDDARLVVVVPVEAVPGDAVERRLPAAQDFLESGKVLVLWGIAAQDRVKVRVHVLELKAHGKLAAIEICVGFCLFDRDGRALAHGQQIIPGQNAAVHLPEIFMHVRAVRHERSRGVAVCPRCAVGQTGGLGDEADDIHAEAVDALLKPPVHHVENLIPHGGIVPVEVRLLFREEVQVVHPGLLIQLPGAAAEAGTPVVGLFAVLPLAPEIVVAVGTVLRGSGFDKPFMLVRAVVDHQVHHDPEAQRVGLFQHLVKVRHGAELGHDVLIVADIVAVVVVGGFVDRGEPDRVRPQLADVFEAAGDAPEIADAVAVGVLKAARIDLIDHAALPPFFCHVYFLLSVNLSF